MEIRPKVFLIDDDAGVLFLHEIIVTETLLHPNPEAFSDANEALTYLSTFDHPSTKVLIFLDLNMPIMNGWQFLEKLESEIQKADVKVIIVTSSLSISDREKSKRYSSVIDFWEKPLDEDQVERLMDKLGNWLELN